MYKTTKPARTTEIQLKDSNFLFVQSGGPTKDLHEGHKESF
jgi:hypothetical protein